VAQGSAADIDAAVKAARKALPGWQKLTPMRARGFCTHWRGRCKNIRGGWRCWKTLDNGKPIRESRDIDIPLVRTAFLLSRGLAQLLEQEFPAIRLVAWFGADYSVEFSALMLGGKLRRHWRREIPLC